MADMLSQEEIDALMGGGSTDEPAESDEAVESEDAVDDGGNNLITADESDALGEIGNISMGTAATTLFTLLGQKVTITTPKLSETTLTKLSEEFDYPLVLIKIMYKVGIDGLNLLVLKENDVKIITDLMMGGDGSNTSGELSELHLSAISEAMNQMIGSSSTSLSELISKKVDISPPEAFHRNAGEVNLEEFDVDPNAHLVKTSFKMTVGDLIDSEIMQILPVDVAKQLVSSLMSAGSTDDEVEEPSPAIVPASEPVAVEPEVPAAPPIEAEQPSQPPPARAAPAPAPRQAPAPQAQVYREPVNAGAVNVQPFEYENFGGEGTMAAVASDIGVISEVPLEITVELGRTSKKISDILDFSIGTVVELERLVGESLDILANGRKIAKGEVVVVDESYGVRITDIIVS